MKYKELLELLGTKRAELKTLLDGCKSETGAFDNATEEQVKAVKDLQTEIEDLAAKEVAMKADLALIEDAEKKNLAVIVRNRPAGPEDDPDKKSEKPQAKSWKELLTKDALDELRKEKSVELPDVDVKTLFSTSAGMPVRAEQESRIVGLPERRFRLLEALPSRTVTNPSVSYLSEKTRTDNADWRLESTQATPSALTESTYEYEELTALARMVGHFVPVTVEQLEDVEELSTLLEHRLMYGLQDKVDRAIINGSGIAPQILGLYNFANIQTQAKGADIIQDTVVKANTKLGINAETTGNLLIMHPSDAEKVLLTKDGNARPIATSEYAVFSELFKSRAETVATAAGTGALLDRNYTLVEFVNGVRIERTNSHASDFTTLKETIRCFVRVRVRLFRQPAVVKLTGL